MTSVGVEGTPGVEKRLLAVEEGTICVYEAGKEHPKTIVLLHGAMYDESRFIWDALFPALSKQYHVFAVDTPRHGGSRPWQGVLDRARLMRILEETFLQLGLLRFSIAGLSMGGGLAIEYAALHPEQIEAMALFEPGGIGDKVDLQWFTYLYIRTPGMLRLLSRQYVKYGDAKVEKLLRTIFTKGTAPENPARLTAILKDEIRGKFHCGENDMDDWQISGINFTKLNWNLLAQVAAIRCPTLWLRGAESKLVKQSEMERAVRIAGENGSPTELIVIPNAGHILPLEQPEQANAAVLAFLEKTL
ncbi:MAG TPA: alpha/beta hydrolase [Clostridia bacterium]|nr:alpha/beta hydrolase [Clostridia bacterium]